MVNAFHFYKNDIDIALLVYSIKLLFEKSIPLPAKYSLTGTERMKIGIDCTGETDERINLYAEKGAFFYDEYMRHLRQLSI